MLLASLQWQKNFALYLVSRYMVHLLYCSSVMLMIVSLPRSVCLRAS